MHENGGKEKKFIAISPEGARLFSLLKEKNPHFNFNMVRLAQLSGNGKKVKCWKLKRIFGIRYSAGFAITGDFSLDIIRIHKALGSDQLIFFKRRKKAITSNRTGSKINILSRKGVCSFICCIPPCGKSDSLF